MGTVTVSKKGWVVIPKEIRERHNIKPGDRVQVVDYGGHVAIVPSLKDPIGQALGLLEGGPSLTEALLDEHARERDWEERRIGVPAATTKDA